MRATTEDVLRSHPTIVGARIGCCVLIEYK